MIYHTRLLSCLGLSLVIHAAFFSIFSQQAIQTLKPTLAKRSLEVSYEQDLSQKTKSPFATFLIQQQEKNKLPKMGTTKDEKPPWTNNKTMTEFFKKDLFNEENSAELAQKPFTKKEDVILNKSVSLPPIPGETLKTPEYKSYYQVIREKIRRLAYYNYRKLQEGEVFLTFSLTSDGDLAGVMINEKKSSANVYLRYIALRSVQDAAPYPEFPGKLRKNNKLSFNVIISFELK